MPLAFGDPCPERYRFALGVLMSRPKAIVAGIKCNCRCFSNSGAKHLEVGFLERPKPRNRRFSLPHSHRFQCRAFVRREDVRKPCVTRINDGIFNIDTNWAARGNSDN